MTARRPPTLRRPPLLPLVLGAAGALAAVGMLACGDGGEEAAAEAPVPTGPSAAELDALASRARGLLETDRPWQAARIMRRYLEIADTVRGEERVLAARAEAGWDNWEEVGRILADVPALDTHEDGLGLYLLGRARDDAGDADGAVAAYGRFLSLSAAASGLDETRSAARLRLGLALLRTGEMEEAREVLTDARRELGESAPWMDILEAEARARVGDTAAVRRTVQSVDGRILELHARRAHIVAAWYADDPALARRLANEARAWARTPGTDAEFLVSAARGALAMGDTAPARDALRSAIDLVPASPYAQEAGNLLQRDPDLMTPADHLAVARVHVARGLHEDALPHFREWLESGRASRDQRQQVGLDHATALFYAGRQDEVAEAVDALENTTAAQRLRARALAVLGDAESAAALYMDLARRSAGVLDLFLAADTWHDAGETGPAAELYRRVIARAPGTDRAGQAMMRLAALAFEDGAYDEAADLWATYRSLYAGGERFLESTYWLGRARAESGDTAAAHRLFRIVRERDRDSYYALLASRRLGEPFWPLPTSASPPADPEAEARVAGWMRGIDLLREAGFPEAADQEATWLAGQTGLSRAERFIVAEALAQRGYGQSAIRVGLGLQTSAPPSRRLLRLLYPFPYRTLIAETALDREIDPFLAAALIRQESMFEARITSWAGARGLMQLMPATARQLAGAAELERWDPELLYEPEINVHLGTMLLAAHLEEYEDFLPAVFSAYNAGPHRVERWSAYPSYGDAELFTERIPFAETRGYVKILTRNRAVYEGLYGGG